MNIILLQGSNITLASLIFVTCSEGMPAVALVISIVSKSSRAPEHEWAVWMVKSVSIHLKTSCFR